MRKEKVKIKKLAVYYRSAPTGLYSVWISAKKGGSFHC